MPNWCSNILKISGTPETIQQLANRLLSEKNDGGTQVKQIDFNRYCPVPDAIHAAHSGGYYSGAIKLLTTPISPETASTLKLADIRKNLPEDYYQEVIEHFPPETLVVDVAKYAYEHYKFKDGHFESSDFEGDNKPDLSINHLLRFDQGILQIQNQKQFGFATWYDWKIAHWGVKWSPEYSTVELTETTITADFETPWNPPYELYAQIVKDFPDIWLEAHYLEEGCGFGGTYSYETEDGTLRDYEAEDLPQFAWETFGFEIDCEKDDD